MGRAGLPGRAAPSPRRRASSARLADLLPLQNTVGDGGAVGRRPRGRARARRHRPRRARVPAAPRAARPRPAGRAGRAAARAGEGHLPGGRVRRGPRCRCGRCGGPPACSAASTTPSTPAPRAGCTTARWPTCPSSACWVATPPRRRACAAAAAKAADASSAGAVSRVAAVSGTRFSVDLTRRRRAVHGDEVDAGHALGQQRPAQLGGDLDPERPDGGLVLRPVAVQRGEPLGEVGRERLTGELRRSG